MDYWLKNYCKSNLRYSTIKKYEVIIEKYLKQNLGIYRLSSITSVSLNAFITELTASSYLNQLEEIGLLESEKIGRDKIYKLTI